MFYIAIPQSFLVNTRKFALTLTDSSTDSVSSRSRKYIPRGWRKLLRKFLQKLNNNRRRAIESVIDTLLP